MKNLKNYPIAYRVDFGEFTLKELKEKELGGCDAIIVHSIMMPPDGSRSEIIATLGPNNKTLPDIEFFKSWVSMAHGLSKSETLPAFHREMAAAVFETVKLAIQESKKFGPDFDILKNDDLSH